jgi:type VI protein secretion system component VasF
MRFFDAIPRWAAILLMLAGLETIHAQVAPPLPPQQRPPTLPGARTQPDDDENPVARQMNEQQALKRNSQRQQQIVDDTTKLLQLAQQLKDEVDKSTKDTLSLSVVKKAEEIEKLAKTVKDKMRDGQ